MRTIILGLCIATFLSSCVTQQKCNEKFPPKEGISKTDSIYIHDSILVYVTPEERDTFTVDCNNDGIYKFNQGGTKITVKIENGEMFVSVFNPERKSVYRDRFKYINKGIVITKTYTIEKIKKEKSGGILLKWWYFPLFYLIVRFIEKIFKKRFASLISSL